MRKKTRTRRATYWGMAAKSTSRDWGHGPVAGKGGKTLNYDPPVTFDKDKKK